VKGERHAYNNNQYRPVAIRGAPFTFTTLHDEQEANKYYRERYRLTLMMPLVSACGGPTEAEVEIEL
jgi:hypothetical protein